MVTVNDSIIHLGISTIGALIRYSDSLEKLRYRLQIYRLAEKEPFKNAITTRINSQDAK